MSKEKKWHWPLINPDEMDLSHLDQILNATSHINSLAQKDLPREYELTIRSLVYAITLSQEEINWYLEGSLHLETALQINSLLNNPNPEVRKAGYQSLSQFIDLFNQDAKEFLSD